MICFSSALSEEEVSVYDLRDHDHYKYRPGAQVLRVGGDQVNDVMIHYSLYNNLW